MLLFIREQMKNILESIFEFGDFCFEVGSIVLNWFLTLLLIFTLPIWIIPYMIFEKKS